jgi:uncharacterized protein
VNSPRTVSQDELIAFLSRADSFPEKPAAVELCQTHISLVAIAPPHVYKVKKAVDLGFLDFSTLKKRRSFCEAEVRLNRRLCRDIYLGVVPIALRNGSLHFGEAGEVVEYAVKMRELPQEGFLHWRLAHTSLCDGDLEPLVNKLSAFYREQDSSEKIAQWGRIENLRLSTDENFAQTERFIGTHLSRAAFEAVRYFASRSYELRVELLERRRREGHIRDCHGDLRCEHVHFSGDEVNIFDCIEFNDRFRYIDVANDLAFLAMDLDFRGRADLATAFLARMSDALRDRDLLALSDFYKCYRAYVRGKVAAIKSLESEVPETERLHSGQKARRFFQLALGYAIAGSEPLVLVLMGRVATGKTTVATFLGGALGWPVFSSDRTRKQLAGVELHQRGDASARAELYQAPMTESTYEELINQAMEQVRGRGSAILDATFGSRAQRDKLRQALATAGVRCCFMEITALDDEIKSRLRHREESATELSDARLEDFEMLMKSYEPLNADEEYLTVPSRRTAEMTAAELLKSSTFERWPDEESRSLT